MTEAVLIQPSLALDPNMVALARLPERISALDARPVLLYDIDAVAAAALPYLAEQLNIVGPLWRYLPDDAARRAAIKGAVAWHRAKGTPWSITTAVGWTGAVAAPDERGGFAGRWAEYELVLQQVPAAADIAAIVALARFSAPARAHLVRVYNVKGDDRPIVLDDGPALDRGMLDNDSGVWVDTDAGPVKVSFGDARGGTLPRPGTHAVRLGRAARRSGRLSYDDRPLLDAWRLDSQILIDAFGGLGALFSGTCNAPALQGGTVFFGPCRGGQMAVAAQTPLVARKELRSGTTSVPVDPPRRWGGRWGGPWRRSYPLITYTES